MPIASFCRSKIYSFSFTLSGGCGNKRWSLYQTPAWMLWDSSPGNWDVYELFIFWFYRGETEAQNVKFFRLCLQVCAWSSWLCGNKIHSYCLCVERVPDMVNRRFKSHPTIWSCMALSKISSPSESVSSLKKMETEWYLFWRGLWHFHELAYVVCQPCSWCSIKHNKCNFSRWH